MAGAGRGFLFGGTPSRLADGTRLRAKSVGEGSVLKGYPNAEVLFPRPVSPKLAAARVPASEHHGRVARISNAMALATSAAFICDPPASAATFPLRRSEIPRITPPLTGGLI